MWHYRQTDFSRQIISYICLFQNAYTQAVTIFLFVVLDLTGYLTIGDMNPRNPYFYLSIISLISFKFLPKRVYLI